MFHATMAAAIDGARTLARMDELSRSIWQAHGSGAVTDDEAQALAAQLSTRRGGLRETVAPVGIPTGRASLFPPRHRQRSPDLIESRYRRRGLAASGPMPPTLARRFTTGQLAVLRIVADEVAAKGVCVLAIDAIAARAGVSGRWAQKALRLAESDGLLTIQERGHKGRKNDPSLVRIISREWQQWLRKRPASRNGRRPAFDEPAATLHRVNSGSPHGYSQIHSSRMSSTAASQGLPEGSGRLRPKRDLGIAEGSSAAGAMR